MENVKANTKEDRKNTVPEMTKIGKMNALTSFITAFFNSFSQFALTLDKLSFSTKLILLILGLSILLPISVGVMLYLTFLGLSLLFKGG